jgi:O-antigen ligase
MTGLSIAAPIDRAKLVRVADGLMVAVAASLPWSTTATGVLVVLWLLALIPTLDWSDVKRELMTPAGGLPVLLFLLGVLGMAWADVTWSARWNGLGSFFKLLAIPLLFAQFRRSEHGLWVFGSYLAACLVLLIATTYVQLLPQYSPVALHADNVLVKNAATQSGEFVTCMLGILFLAQESFRRGQWFALVGIFTAVLGMLANMFYVSTGRTALVVIPVLLVLFAAKRLDHRGTLILVLGAILLSAIGWYSSPYLRERTTAVWTDFRHYEKTDQRNSSGERIEFYKKSLAFLREAPVIGHGTGSIHELFEKSAIGKTGAEGSATTNPHNQTFAVAIQLGLTGVLVLWAMWVAHLLLFRGNGLIEWIGLVLVVQNIVGSAFNSHLFDFVQGWTYVVGVGIAGGMVLKARADKGPSAAAQ